MKKKVLVSGVQSSGKLHIGNYFGAIRQNVELGNSGDYESYVFIADYHSMTSLTDAAARRENTFDAACVYLACGLDPEKVTFFKQSDVPEHTELSWILNTVTPMPMLMLAHSFKDKSTIKLVNKGNIIETSNKILNKISLIILDLYRGKDSEILNNYFVFLGGNMLGIATAEKDETIALNLINKDFVFNPNSSPKILYIQDSLSFDRAKDRVIDVSNLIEPNEKQIISTITADEKLNSGLFTYPVLMAADILMYNADVVPVGKDQEQHLEITRELAGKYNRAYGVEQFVMPKAHIVGDVATVPGVDGRKMSKSYDNHIPLFGTPEEIKKRVMSIVTDSAAPVDSKKPDENNIYQIHKLFLSTVQDIELRSKFENGGYGYKQAKDELLETILNFSAPMRGKYEYYRSNRDEVESILKSGAENAKSRAQQTMLHVKKQTGLSS